MNWDLNNRVNIKKRKAIMPLLVLMIFAFWDGSKPSDAGAEMERLNKAELSAVTGAGGVDFSIIGNTARVYFDMHMETYAEIDSLKLGYYQRENLQTRKFLAPEDPMVQMHRTGGNDAHPIEPTFSLWPYINNSGGTKVPVYNNIFGSLVYAGFDAYPPAWTGYAADAKYTNGLFTFDPGTPLGPFDSYLYTEADGISDHYIPYTDNSNYQTKYNNTLGQRYIEGLQGLNDESLLSADFFSSVPSENQNFLDWDINVENLRLGTSPENPAVIDGLVIHLKYDDITKADKKLTDIIIGTNSLEGNFFGDFIRATGYLNPKLPHSARDTGAISLEGTGNFSKVFNEAPVPVSMKRDSFLMLVDHFRAEYFDDQPGIDDKVYYPVPNDPTNNDIHTGFFLRLGLDPTDEQHFGYSLIAGYNEIVANAYEPSDMMLQDALYHWWNE